jgi:DNA-binding CsgD family transcriptional regulator
MILIEALRFSGRLALERGDFRAADEHLNAALDLAKGCDAPFEHARVQLGLAELRKAGGAPRESAELAHSARDTFLRLQATPSLLKANALVNALASAPALMVYPAGLTAREVEVLRLVAQGQTDAGAADVLSISPRTVSQHLRSIYGKVGISSRAAATRFAIENGLS